MQVHYIDSGLTYSSDIKNSCERYIRQLCDVIGESAELIDADQVAALPLPIVFIGTGGTENKFLQIFKKSRAKEWLILTNGENNSLAASMEILAYLKQQGRRGEIIHGDPAEAGRKLKASLAASSALDKLRGMRLGQLGEPSDWLIASNADPDALRDKFGMELVNISMEEFFAEFSKNTYEPNQYTEAFLKKDFDSAETEKALCVYGAIRRIVDRYQLSGITVRCFDLLGPIRSTGCLALSILNAEGIFAGCEGDMPALVSMAVLGTLTGQPCFMCNPNRLNMEENTMVLAHCTLPCNMPSEFTLDTHFESDLGVAIIGKIPTGGATIFKLSPNADRYFVSNAEITKNLSERTLCRTQIELKPDASLEYFLKDPICNHHVVINGHYKFLVDSFFSKLYQ